MEVGIILKYFVFIFKCLYNHSNFFSYSALEKAKLLSDSNLCFWAGLYYMNMKEYADAASCFEKSKAYKHLIIAYEKQGLYSKAINLAEKKGFYELGAKISSKINDLKQTAYFYSFFDSLHAAKLYRNLYCYYEAGYCYLSRLDALNAIDMFRRCSDHQKKEQGLYQVSRYALTLYFSKDYEPAFRIFIALDDYYSALECARKINHKQLIDSCHYLISLEEASNNNFHFAAECIKHIDTTRAICYYAKAGDYNSQVNLLIQNKNYEIAIQVCMIHNDLNKAYQIASTYHPALLLT